MSFAKGSDDPQQADGAPSFDPGAPRSPEAWTLPPLVQPRVVLLLLVASMVLAVSAHRTEIDRGFAQVGELMAESVGLVEESDIGTGARNFVRTAFPLVFEERRDTARIVEFDSDDLPWLARLEQEEVLEYSFETRREEVVGTRTVLVEPMGYLVKVVGLMLQTLEIALWGTILAVLISIPLSVLTARNTSPYVLSALAGRSLCGLFRAVPELISALIFVQMFGFGPVAGVLALGLHTSGLLGKFIADDIENADPGPQEALRAIGAGRLQVLRYAVVPQILPQALAYTQYILERNVRSATVLGIVGAGGIGMELKGRWDLSEFGHVSTILLIIFITVVILEQSTQRFRTKLIM